jgi:hypothetical protein
MSGYFQEFKADYKPIGNANGEKNPKTAEYEEALVLEGIRNIKKSSEDNVKDDKNNLAEKNLNTEKEKYLTEIKNPNVLENLEMNPFKQFQNESHPMQNNYFDPVLRLDSESLNIAKSIQDSQKKTPDKEPTEKKNNSSNIHFSFKKEDPERVLTPNVINQQNKFLHQIQSPAYKIKESPFYMVSPGGISMMMQKANAKPEAFMSPKINSTTFPGMRGANAGGLFKVNFPGEEAGRSILRNNK